jgi:hypothetical protein
MAKKRIHSKRKGNRAELELAKILTERFGVPFARVGVSSGARPKQVKLDGRAKQSFTSDLVVPDGFRFSVECKAVNVDVDLLDRNAWFDKSLEQAENDASSIGKIPMLCCKRSRKGWIIAIPLHHSFKYCGNVPTYRSIYRTWLVCRLDALLVCNQAEEAFWWDTITSPPPTLLNDSTLPKLLTCEEER